MSNVLSIEHYIYRPILFFFTTKFMDFIWNLLCNFKNVYIPSWYLTSSTLCRLPESKFDEKMYPLHMKLSILLLIIFFLLFIAHTKLTIKFKQDYTKILFKIFINVLDVSIVYEFITWPIMIRFTNLFFEVHQIFILEKKTESLMQ